MENRLVQKYLKKRLNATMKKREGVQTSAPAPTRPGPRPVSRQKSNEHTRPARRVLKQNVRRPKSNLMATKKADGATRKVYFFRVE